MTARSASLSAVRGSARTSGCSASGKRSAEKKIPEQMNIGIMTTFMSPVTVSIAGGPRRDQQADARERERAQDGHEQRPPANEPRTGRSNAKWPKARRKPTSIDAEHHPDHHVRGEEVARGAAAWRAGASSSRLMRMSTRLKPMPHIPPLIRFMPIMPGDQEVDVAAARARRPPPRGSAAGPARPAARCSGVVHARAGQRPPPGASGRDGTRRWRARRAAGHHHDVDPAQPQGLGRLRLAERPDLEELRAPSARSDLGRRRGASSTATAEALRRPVAEREAQPDRQEDGEDEAPEDDLGLAVELAEAGEAQGAEGAERAAESFIAQVASPGQRTRTRPRGWRGAWSGC